jgi:hypothetical protein
LFLLPSKKRISVLYRVFIADEGGHPGIIPAFPPERTQAFFGKGTVPANREVPYPGSGQKPGVGGPEVQERFRRIRTGPETADHHRTQGIGAAGPSEFVLKGPGPPFVYPVTTRTNTGPQDDRDLFGPGIPVFPHQGKSLKHYPRPPPAGMEEAEGAVFCIKEVYRKAIRHGNRKPNPPVPAYQTIGLGLILGMTPFPNQDIPGMNLG